MSSEQQTRPLPMRHMLGLLLLFALAGLTVFAERGQDLSRQEVRAGPIVSGEVLVSLGSGWCLFEFGGEGSTSQALFVVTSEQNVVMQLTDLQCPGDEFEIIKDNIPFGNSSTLNPSIDYTSCSITTIDPNVAFNSANGTWSTFSAVLLPGTHGFSFRVLKSPFQSGFAAVRFDKDRTPPDPRDPFESTM